MNSFLTKVVDIKCDKALIHHIHDVILVWDESVLDEIEPCSFNPNEK